MLYGLGWHFIFIDQNPMLAAVGKVWEEHVSLLRELLADIDGK
ncbi:hypothetical protein [Actinomyces mediterranea]|nr:hypothetical protein [Actinomyces mediterranea]